MKFKTTPLFKRMIEFYVDARGKKDPSNGRTALPTIYNSGSSRSAKTYTAIQVIITILNHNQNRNLYVAVLRDTLVDCRKYTFKDFKEALQLFDMIDKCDIIEYPNPKIKLWGNTIEFMGLPEANKQPPRTDICFFNEATEIVDQVRVKGLLMRCEMLAIFDWNPSYSKHWVYDGDKVFNSLFTRTTYLDNPFLSDMVISNIESKCPWDFADSHMEVRDGFKVRVWDKPEDERMPNIANIEAGTADRWYWLVYGEGIPAAREGAIFPNVEWINEFPDTGFDEVVISMDLGFTCFDGNTKISIPNGEKDIKNIEVGDLVISENGIRKVSNFNDLGINKVSRVFLSFDFGYREIIATFDHKFKTDKGWKQLNQLQKGDMMYTLVPSTGKSIKDMKMENTQNTSFQQTEKKQGYTGIFGNFIEEKYQKAILFTTSMALQLITGLRIWLLLQEQNILKYMDFLMDGSQKQAIQKKTGVKDVKLPLRICLKRLGFVINVARSMFQQTFIKNSVLTNVATKISIQILWLLRIIFANGAEVLLSVTNTLNAKLAQKNVCMRKVCIKKVIKISEYHTNVYDISVEGGGSFFANGLLAHNCDPTTLVRIGRAGMVTTVENMLYQPTKTPEICFESLKPNLIIEQERRRREGVKNYDELWICCESSDRYGTEMFVDSLNMLASAEGRNWNFFKVSKISISAGVSIMQRFKMKLVYNKHFEAEQQNYVYKMYKGEPTNEPDPESKFNHIWDAVRYAFQTYFYWAKNINSVK